MKNIVLFLALAAPALFAQTNVTLVTTATNSPKTVVTNGPLVTAIDGYAARVDGTIITYGEVRESVAPYMQQISRKYKGKELAERIQAAYLDAREALIEEALLKAETKTLKATLPDKVIDDEINRLIRERFNNDRALLSRALAERRMTYEEWKQEVTDQITVRIFYNQEVSRRASVPAQAVRDEYERNKEQYFVPFRVKYHFILISKGKTEEDRAVKRKQAENTLQKLRAGADFIATAKEVSESDIDEAPWRNPDDVRAELRPALLNTPAGQISDLIETSGGFYIVKVEERREKGYTPFEEVQKAIEKKLLDAEKDRLHDDLLKRVSAKHFIERY
ncbi:MAG TPA: peptidyl-prolyl cis-trans isomerase [Pontiellaceae bacterium]|nr:peptidyl-prolyl cis-trans isomerase [Pontiellaceae bacterium]